MDNLKVNEEVKMEADSARDSENGDLASDEPPRLIVLTIEPKPITYSNPNILRQKLMPTLERLFQQEPESRPFLQPVDPVLLGIPDYFDIIKKPMDLSTIKWKFDNDEYWNGWQYVDDIWLMFGNAWSYNDKTSYIYSCCTKLAEVFEEAINPPMQELGYCCGRKYIVLNKNSSRKALHIDDSPIQTTNGLHEPFHCNLIVKEVPSPADDSSGSERIYIYNPGVLRQKLMPILERLLQEQPECMPFLKPVDPSAVHIPHYFDIVERPMDLSLIKRKLDMGYYEDPWEYVEDIWLMFDNAWLFNSRTSHVYRCCTKLARVFEGEIDAVMQSMGYCCGKKSTIYMDNRPILRDARHNFPRNYFVSTKTVIFMD